MSGPIQVQDAEPGDLLVVELLDIGPLQGYEWGYTAIFTPENGSSFLPDHFKEAHKAIWHFEGRYCHSRHIPGVRVAG